MILCFRDECNEVIWLILPLLLLCCYTAAVVCHLSSISVEWDAPATNQLFIEETDPQPLRITVTKLRDCPWQRTSPDLVMRLLARLNNSAPTTVYCTPHRTADILVVILATSRGKSANQSTRHQHDDDEENNDHVTRGGLTDYIPHTRLVSECAPSRIPETRLPGLRVLKNSCPHNNNSSLVELSCFF